MACTVEKLVMTLQNLPAKFQIMQDGVGNVIVFDPREGAAWPIGALDLAKGEFVLYHDERGNDPE